MIYICNAFSIQMLQGYTKLEFNKKSLEEIKGLLDFFNEDEIISAIGHADMAKLISDQLGRCISVNRVSVKLKYNDALIVAQYSGPRLPEGAIVLPEGATIEFWTVYQN